MPGYWALKGTKAMNMGNRSITPLEEYVDINHHELGLADDA